MDYHTYYVGENSILVHNANGKSCSIATNTANKATENAKEAIGNTETNVIEIELSRKKYPESVEHIEDAIASGQPEILTIDRSGAKNNRQASLKGIDKIPGMDLDEYPPAMSKEGGKGASVRGITSSDNRGSGSKVGYQLRKYKDGTKYKIKITE